MFTFFVPLQKPKSLAFLHDKDGAGVVGSSSGPICCITGSPGSGEHRLGWALYV